jgi:membrane protein involved in colicin uptake
MWGYVAELPHLSTASLKEVAAVDAAMAARRAAAAPAPALAAAATAAATAAAAAPAAAAAAAYNGTGGGSGLTAGGGGWYNGATVAAITAEDNASASLNLGDGLVVDGYGRFLIDHLHRGLTLKGVDVRLGTPNPNP